MPDPITSKPVLVTGATGFIGAELTRQLLERGYRVRGTTRDVAGAIAGGHLGSLEGAGERLELVEGDVLDAGWVRAAATGCSHVFHVASPYEMDARDPQRELVDPAVNGARAVIQAARESGTVRRIVLTSSGAAITDRADGRLLDEQVWNTTSSLTRSPYYFSKAEAERAAWDALGEEDPFDLITVNPFVVMGPSIVPRLNTSHQTLVGLTDGAFPAILAIPFAIVDVRDVAAVHILAKENPSAHGRYLTAAGTRSLRQITELLAANGWGERYPLPRLPMDNRFGALITKLVARTRPPGIRAYMENHVGGEFRFDNSKVREELGMVFRDVDETILDAMADLERRGQPGKEMTPVDRPALTLNLG